jgi:hypothetical protein
VPGIGIGGGVGRGVVRHDAIVPAQSRLRRDPDVPFARCGNVTLFELKEGVADGQSDEICDRPRPAQQIAADRIMHCKASSLRQVLSGLGRVKRWARYEVIKCERLQVFAMTVVRIGAGGLVARLASCGSSCRLFGSPSPEGFKAFNLRARATTRHRMSKS